MDLTPPHPEAEPGPARGLTGVAPDLEIYGPEFDPHTGAGVLEFWIAVG